MYTFLWFLSIWCSSIPVQSAAYDIKRTFDTVYTQCAFHVSTITGLSDPDTQLINAAKEGNVEAVRYLTQYGVARCTYDNNGKSPLHYTCLHGHYSVAQYLIYTYTDTLR